MPKNQRGPKKEFKDGSKKMFFSTPAEPKLRSKKKVLRCIKISSKLKYFLATGQKELSRQGLGGRVIFRLARYAKMYGKLCKLRRKSIDEHNSRKLFLTLPLEQDNGLDHHMPQNMYMFVSLFLLVTVCFRSYRHTPFSVRVFVAV